MRFLCVIQPHSFVWSILDYFLTIMDIFLLSVPYTHISIHMYNSCIWLSNQLPNRFSNQLNSLIKCLVNSVINYLVDLIFNWLVDYQCCSCLNSRLLGNVVDQVMDCWHCIPLSKQLLHCSWLLGPLLQRVVDSLVNYNYNSQLQP